MRTDKRGGRLFRFFGRLLILLGAAVIAFLVFFDIWIKPTIDRVSVYQCSRIAERAISGAVLSHIGDTGEASSLVSFIYDEDGRITALQTDTAGVNRLKALLTDLINDELSSASAGEVGVSLGTLTGISWLYGRGGELRFPVRPTGSAQTRLKCTFKSAGINQTAHSIILEVTTAISPLIPGFTEQIDVTTEYVLAQTVLLGEVPETYSNIILDENYQTELADFNLTG